MNPIQRTGHVPHRRQGQRLHDCPRHRQAGVAVITALLLTTLAVTIVASLFWQQQVQVRSIENQRMQLQKQWILRGALDWARLILVTSQASSPMVDSLQQPWSVGLAQTRLDSYVENGRSDSEASDATITGQIIDAQSYLNLAGLAVNGVPQPKAIAAFGRLLGYLRLEPQLAATAAGAMAAGQPRTVAPANGTTANGATTGASNNLAGILAGTGVSKTTAMPAAAPAAQASASLPSGPRPLAIAQIDDLLSLPGFTPAVVARLRGYTVILPRAPTTVNINTASAEVLAATLDTLSLPAAQGLVASRNSVSFNSVTGDARLAAALQGADMASLSVRTDYFIVDGKVRLNRAGLEVLALIERNPTPTASTGGAGGTAASKIIWIREN